MAKEQTNVKTALPLGARIFILLAALLVIAVGGAVGVTWVEANRIANAELQSEVEQSHLARQRISDQRFDILSLIAELVAGDADLVAYIEVATGVDLGFGGSSGLDRRSALDLLLERQAQTGFDFAILMDPDGVTLVRTDRPDSVAEDFSTEPLVADVVATLETGYGLWADRRGLYEVVVTPMVRDFELVGFLMAGLAVDDRTAGSVAELTRGEVAYLLAPDYSLVASSAGDAEVPLMAALLNTAPSMAMGDEDSMGPVSEFAVNGDVWFAVAEPLDDGAGRSLGMAVSLTERQVLFGGYNRILNILVIAGVVALLLALLASLWLSRYILKPLSALTEASEAAASGDYEAELDDSGVAELSRVCQAFNSLLSDLREKNDMEGYVAELSRHLPEPKVEVENTSTASRIVGGTRSCAVLAVTLPTIEPRKLQELIIAIDGAAQAHGGTTGALSQRSAVLCFDGSNGAAAAVRCWGALGEEAPQLAKASAGVTVGEVSFGEARFHSSRVPLATGATVRQAETLAQDAAPSALFFSPQVGKLLHGDGLPVATAKGRSGKKYYAVDRKRVNKWKSELVTASPDDHTVVSGGAKQTTGGRVLQPGMMFGNRFEILGKLGQGGMGVVYKARDLDLDDLVALKTLRGEALRDPTLLSRLKSELKLARRITHPNVLRTFDFGEIDSTPFISMEYIRGLTLRYLLKRAGRLPYSAGLRLARQLCSGLDAAHQVGVLHRDIKPENVIVEERGNAKLMDFGIARPIVRDQPGETQPGMFIGTPTYSSPEQLAGQEPDQRADIYSVGIVLCELFTGKLPVSGANTVELAMAHMHNPPQAPSELWPEIPQVLEEIILKCLEKQPDDRYSTAGDLTQALSQLRA